MSYRSTLLIVIVVFGILFALLSTSSYVNNARSENFFKVLEAKKADASLFRLVKPEQACFSLQEKDLVRYAFLSTLIEQADTFVNDPMPSINNNRYDGFGMELNASDAVSLIKTFQNEFNYTFSNEIVRGYYDSIHLYDCNVEYNGNQYYIQIEFRSLTALDENSGYVPISIREDGIVATTSSARIAINGYPNNLRNIVNPSNLDVFITFNNTIIWRNVASSWVQLRLNTTGFEGEPITISAQIPPGRSWDYRLSHNYRSIEPTVYDYIVEGDGIDSANGKITVNFYPVPCMSQEEARSLYGQSGIAIRFPSYLPDGYEYKCGIHYDHFMMLQTYWNQSTPTIEEFANSSTRDEMLNNGVIQVFAIKAVPLWYEWADKTAKERFEALAQGDYHQNYLDLKLVDLFEDEGYEDGLIEAVAYRHNSSILKEINILEVYDQTRSETYIFKGKLPLSELVMMAESMYTAT